MNMAITEGEEIHGGVVKFGIFSNVYVSIALVDMYTKFEFMGRARKVFDEMAEINQVSWTALGFGSATGDCLHPHQDIIHLTLGQLWKHMNVDMIY
ncbi:hypothetical protein K1719_004075 [Acacia pycnantha]|nr:hypothetical protein K1719_004075 [Acacia pycnantha]